MLYFLFISWFICSRRWYIDKLEVIHANQISMCLDSHLNWGWGWRPETDLIPPVKYFTDHSKAVLLCGPFMFFLFCVCYAFVRVCLFVPCGHLLGKGWPLFSRLWCLIVSLSLSHWYPVSVMVLDCIESWSLHPYLFFLKAIRSNVYFTVFSFYFCFRASKTRNSFGVRDVNPLKFEIPKRVTWQTMKTQITYTCTCLRKRCFIRVNEVCLGKINRERKKKYSIIRHTYKWT